MPDQLVRKANEGPATAAEVRERMRSRGAYRPAWIAVPEYDSGLVRDAVKVFTSRYGGRAVVIAPGGPADGGHLDLAQAAGPGRVRFVAPPQDDYPESRLRWAMQLVARGEAGGVVAGATTSSAAVLRAARQQLAGKTGQQWMSEAVHLVADGRVMAFADIAVTPEPTAGQLATIADDTARQFTRLTGIPAVVAMLSFSTHGSARGAAVEKVRAAADLLRRRRPELVVDGELQFDTAYSTRVARVKAPASAVAGAANVFVFPDLNSANIGYKIAQFLGGSEVLAMVPAGLRWPVVDLSRGSQVDDVVSALCVCAALCSTAT
ncbi:phosphate acyltransferase [Amycolatopsis jejuensis]|uniref:phosphate acyltransferase n=1 Tax=Amycolatopsis jejuensis TaxID=330084 RepID=UPI00068EAD3B|nr:phosphate acyltransferase [Amycolatopsis jejuensis]